MKNQELINKMNIWEKALLMSGRDIWSTWEFKHLGIEPIYLSDGPHGIRKQLGESDHLGLNESVKATCFPPAATVANSWNLQLGKEIGTALGREALELGVNVILGPGMNIKRNPLCGRNFEYFSEDPLLSGKFAASYVQGIQSKGVSACPKHFAVNNQELRRMHNNSVVDKRTLHEIYLRGFKYAIDAKPDFIMTSYNKVNGTYANENKHLLIDVLRDKWGYQGAVVSDWGGSVDHVAGVKSRSSLEMPGTRAMGAKELVDAIADGTLLESDLNTSVDDLLTVILKLQNTQLGTEGELSTTTIEEHHQLARKVAAESIVLLKNDNKLLPLSGNTKVCLVGDFAQMPRYQGAGSSVVNSTKLENTIENMSAYFSDYEYVQGYERNGRANDRLAKEALAAASNAQVVIVYAGLPENYESEGVDRQHMFLPENQNHLIQKLVKTGNKVIVVLQGGSPVEIPWLSQVQALVHSYLSGQGGALATLDVLVGKVNPSGKLSETYVNSYNEIPSSNYFPGLEFTSEYREGLMVGYRYFSTFAKPVLFPFGFGLSYSEFELCDFKVDYAQLKVNVTITNCSATAGSEVVQVYAQSIKSNVFIPKLQLIGFEKVKLNPGESRELDIELDENSFKYFNIHTDNWEQVAGQYRICIGNSSDNFKFTTEISTEATAAVSGESNFEISYYQTDLAAITNENFTKLMGNELPTSNWDRSADLTYSDTISQLEYGKNPFARLVHFVLKQVIKRNDKRGTPDLNTLFVYNQTFTAIYKMTNGIINKVMIGHLLEIINGHFFRGITKLGKEYKKNKLMSTEVYSEIEKIEGANND